MKKILVAILVGIVVVGFGYVVTIQVPERAAQDDRKKYWSILHGCKRVNYAGSSARSVYGCNDGAVYTWADMPEQPLPQ